MLTSRILASEQVQKMKKFVAKARCKEDLQVEESHLQIQKYVSNSVPNSATEYRKDLEIEKHDIGFIPVDIRGRPLVHKGNTGTWKAASFILATEMAERMTYIGLLANAVSYLVFDMHLTFPKASDVATNVAGASNLTPLLGAFIADTYLGRFWTILVFGLIYFVGLLLLSVQAFIPSLRPSKEGCTLFLAATGGCKEASGMQLTVLYLSLYTIALGTGGITPCVSAFGADQFDEEDPTELAYLPSYFNAFYFFISLGAFMSLTLVVNISESFAFKWGYLILLLSMFLALTILVIGVPRYRHRLPSAKLSPLTRVAQVITAAVRKTKLKLPEDSLELYEVYDKESAIIGSRKIVHTPTQRWLDKAAVATDEERDLLEHIGSDVSPWKLCTVTQVEEVKALIHILPIWCSGILTNMAFIQIVNFALQGGTSMDRNINGYQIPVPTLGVVSTVLVAISLPLYNQFFVPLMRKYTGHSRGITLLQRQGSGQIIMVLGLVVAGVVENRRRAEAWDLGVQGNPLAPLKISAFWVLPAFCLVGLGEIFAMVGQLEFFYDQAPDAMRSFGVAIFTANAGVGAFMGTANVHIVNAITPKPGWVAVNINLGHMDYYYYFLAVLNLTNFFLFVWCAHRYKYKTAAKSTRRDAIMQKVLLQEQANGHHSPGAPI